MTVKEYVPTEVKLMSDREMLLLAYGTLKGTIDRVTSIHAAEVVKTLEKHLWPLRIKYDSDDGDPECP